MDPINFSLLAILFTIFSYLFYQCWKVNQYWKDRNVPYVKPWLFFGNSASVIFLKESQGECLKSICDQYPNEPIVGFYDIMRPSLLIKDLDLIEKVLIKDFIHFVDRGLPVDEDRNPLDSNLFSMCGKRWKAVRNRLSPIFTTGRLKQMYDSMADCGNELVSQMGSTKEIEMREILSSFAMDVIGSSAFGIDVKNLANPDNEFRTAAKKVFHLDTLRLIKFILIINFPSIMKKFNLSFNDKNVLLYFRKIINETMKHRRDNGYQRKDFLQMLMQLQEKGYVEIQTKDPADDYLNVEPTYSTEKFELTNDQVTAQAIVFLTAGFEATTLSMTYALYELAKNPAIQEKVREEVRKEVNNAGGVLTYDAVKEMNYLEQCVKEAMRKYPPAPVVFRLCTKEYTFPNGLTIKPGQPVIIPVLALHHDPNFFPEPEKFKPERFDPDQNIHPCTYLPFGNGPRICIAMRFAMLEMKYCIAKLMMNYNFQISPKTKEPLTFKVRSFFTSPNERIFFNVTKINN